MPPTAPQPPKAGPDWTTQAADRLESVVTTVRDKTTVPVQKAARAVVCGLIGAVLGSVALVLLVVALFRLHVYIPVGNKEGRKVWIADVAVGAIFVLLGGLLWSRRKPRHKE
jgi:hypothetical protein